MKSTRMKLMAGLAALAALGTAAAWTLSATAANRGDSAGGTAIGAVVPAQCEAFVTSSRIVSLSPLQISASIRRKCNTSHDLTVLFPPDTVTQPTRLSVSLAGAGTPSAAPGTRLFANLPWTDTTSTLTIRYPAGTLRQRQTLARSWRISVSAR
jgi:hypothetical protein